MPNLDPIQLLLTMKNMIGPQLLEAERQVDHLSTKLGVAENAASGALGKVGGMASALGGLGAMAGPMLAFTGVAAVIGAVGAAAGKAAANLRELEGAAEQLQNLSAKTGSLPSNLQALQVQLEQMGIPTESLGTGLKFLQKAISDSNPVLARLGVTSTDTYGALLQLSDVFEKLPDGPTKTALAMELLGSRGGQALIPLLNQGSAGITAMSGHLRDLGVALDDITLNKLAALDNAQDEADAAWKGMTNTLSVGLIPATQVWLKFLTDVANSLSGIAKSPVWGQLSRLVDVLAYDTSKDARARVVNGKVVFSQGGGASWDDAQRYGPPMPNFYEQQVAAILSKGVAGSGGSVDMAAIMRLAGLYGANADATSPRRIGDDPKKTMDALIKVQGWLKDVRPVALQAGDAGRYFTDKMEFMSRLGRTATDSISYHWSNAVDDVVRGTRTIGGAFHDLIASVLQDLASSGIKSLVSLGLEAVGFAASGGSSGIIGGIKAGMSAAPVTIHNHVNAFSAKDVLRSATTQTGEIRNANAQLAIRSRLP